MSPIAAPPRVRRSASRSAPAEIARRTLMSLNGSCVMLSAIQRPPPLGTSWIWSFWFWSAVRRTAGGGGVSPLIMLWPSRTFRAITVESSLP